jgi:hypothetical protein
VQVAKHFVAVPAAEQADDVAVDLRAKECHGPGCAERACRDIRRKKANGRPMMAVEQRSAAVMSAGRINVGDGEVKYAAKGVLAGAR